MPPKPRTPAHDTHETEQAHKPRKQSVDEGALRGQRQPVNRPDETGEVQRERDQQPDPRV